MELRKVKLGSLLEGVKDVVIHGSTEVEIVGLCNHSHNSRPGFLFVAKQGSKSRGADFLAEAVEKGAVAVLVEEVREELRGIVQIVSAHAASVESFLADRFYQSPSKRLLTVGVTGTNGKTSSCYLLRHLFQALGKETGLLGTIEWIIKDRVVPSALTTPDLLTTQALFCEMEQAGCSNVVMEVSSHALEQGRVSGIDFSVALYTNLTQDHLDYHKNMEAYALAKAKLFSSLSSESTAVINIDCPWGSFMKERSHGKVLTYGFSELADVRATDLVLSPQGSSCSITYLEKTVAFRTPLIGKFSIYNCLGVIGVALSLGFALDRVAEIISSFENVQGRLEKVGTAKQIFVDYAHTEDALKNVLETLKEVASGKLVCVFGCGGDRDRGKRAKMGAVVEQLADRVFITSDNPRSEDPQEIIAEILRGIKDIGKVHVEVDRREAIAQAIQGLSSDDILLIAGKGHENKQIFRDYAIHFDDRIVAKEYCQ